LIAGEKSYFGEKTFKKAFSIIKPTQSGNTIGEIKNNEVRHGQKR